mmetsp:Transcript_15167/g.45712  ORF Transcript_15167/g.45712 Transcript_15167/m.45712 type:complete len:279 (+) Transcript_15167:1716-2552(+)
MMLLTISRLSDWRCLMASRVAEARAAYHVSSTVGPSAAAAAAAAYAASAGVPPAAPIFTSEACTAELRRARSRAALAGPPTSLPPPALLPPPPLPPVPGLTSEASAARLGICSLPLRDSLPPVGECPAEGLSLNASALLRSSRRAGGKARPAPAPPSAPPLPPSLAAAGNTRYTDADAAAAASCAAAAELLRPKSVAASRGRGGRPRLACAPSTGCSDRSAGPRCGKGARLRRRLQGGGSGAGSGNAGMPAWGGVPGPHMRWLLACMAAPARLSRCCS